MKYFSLCLICLCYFHLVQNLWEIVQLKGLATNYSEDPMIRKSFKYVKALVYLPIKFVPSAFVLISKQASEVFVPILNYFVNSSKIQQENNLAILLINGICIAVFSMVIYIQFIVTTNFNPSFFLDEETCNNSLELSY
jgi:hypothetical protein